MWYNYRQATQPGRFTLWHNSRRAKQPGFIDACTRSRIPFPKTVTNHALKYEGLIQSKIFVSTQMQSRKNLPYLLHRTPDNAQNTQHELGVAFLYLERN